MREVYNLLKEFVDNEDAKTYPVIVSTDGQTFRYIGDANTHNEAVAVGLCHGISCEKCSHGLTNTNAHFFLLH